MKTSNKIFALLVSLLFFGSCKTTIESPEPLSGDVEFTTYVALGSSFTAGYTDAALYREGQENSFPAMLAKVFAEAGGGSFKQPMVQEGVGIGVNGNAKLNLNYGSLCNGISGYSTSYAASAGDQTILTTSVASEGPFNNLGVPGTKSGDFDDQFFVNPFYARFASNPGASTILSDAVSVNPSFFTLLIGIEDVYQYALKGGDENIASLITSTSDFSDNVNNIVSTLVSSGADGAIANIPDPDDFPYFTKLAYDGLVLTQAKANDLNAKYISIGYNFNFQEGNNPFVMKYDSSGPRYRLLSAGEYVLISVFVDSVCRGYGSFDFPNNMAWGFEDKDVLTVDELSYIRQRIIEFNNKLKSVAAANNIAFVDLFDFFRRLHQGIVFNGVAFNSTFIDGKAISLDGFHPCPQGYALIANEFIRAINAKFGSTLHEVDVNSYPGIKFP